jgi:hypothetical protein
MRQPLVLLATSLMFAGCAPATPAPALPVAPAPAPAPITLTAAPAFPPGPTPTPVAPYHPSVADARIFIRYAHYWDQPMDDEAVELVRTLAKTASDWPAFRQAAPAGSHQRVLVEHFIEQFEQAGELMKAGVMSPDLYFDMWYSVEGFWAKLQPWVVGLRTEAGRPDLYATTEWLASESQGFHDKSEKSPKTWPPLETAGPTTDDVMLFYDFAAMWQSQRDSDAEAFVKKLVVDAPDVPTFERLVKRNTHEWTMFDRVFCETDQAGVLVKNGVLRTDLAALVRDPVAWWDIGKRWIVPLRAKYPHLYEDTEAFAARVAKMRARR